MPATPLRAALTMGDPCGIGPELWVRILCQRFTAEAAEQLALGSAVQPQLVLFGDAGVLARTAAQLGLAGPWQAACADPTLSIVAVSALSADESQPAQPTVAAGAAQVAYLQAAIALAKRGEVHGICTAPIHKAWAKAGGLAFPGHTELLGKHLRAAAKEVMMLAGPSLRVALATTHIALREVSATLSIASLADTIATTARALQRDFGIVQPRLWVAALNPHAGEQGHFGDEEGRIISPAIAFAQQALADVPGTTIEGPLPPDALFRAAVSGPAAARPDAVVAMYHDQGLIPLKLLDFDQAVNITLGLRIVRTSPDHGVAYDIAGRGIASPRSQAAALELCLSLSARRAAATL